MSFEIPFLDLIPDGMNKKEEIVTDYVKKQKYNEALTRMNNKRGFKTNHARFFFLLKCICLFNTNHVSTPTKISTYLSCGIIPIFTESIRDFYNLMLNREFKIVFHRESFLDEVLKFKRIDKTKIRSEYLDIFNSYYSSSTYEQLIIKKLEKMQ